MSVAKRHIEPVSAFSDLFEQSQNRLSSSGTAIIDWRRGRFTRFNATGIPTQRFEPWKFTNIAKIANQPMRLAARENAGIETMSNYLVGGPKARRMIFVNGHLIPSVSHTLGLPRGVKVRSLAELLQNEPETLIEALDGVDDGRSFTDLNSAFLDGGALIEVPDGVVVDEPVQLLFLTVGQSAATMVHPRILVRLGENAGLNLMEVHAASDACHVLTNLVSQISIGASASLTHDRVQLGRDGTTLIGKAAVELADAASI